LPLANYARSALKDASGRRVLCASSDARAHAATCPRYPTLLHNRFQARVRKAQVGVERGAQVLDAAGLDLQGHAVAVEARANRRAALRAAVRRDRFEERARGRAGLYAHRGSTP